MSKNTPAKSILNLIVCCIIGYTFVSCSKTVYSYNDDLGESQFVIYSDNYKYIEKSKYGKFHMWGKYEIKGDTICFDVIDLENIPYTYVSNRFTKLANTSKSEFIYITVVDEKHSEPIIFASVLMKDSLHRIVAAAQTDIDGHAMIRNSTDYSYIDIDYLGYSKFRLDYQIFKNHQIRIEMEQLETGGLTVGTCLLYESGGTLKYKMIDNTNLKTLEKNGIIFLSKD